MLYLVATPIGNMSDISLRALEVLREVDFVVSEDTRKTGVLLKKFEIKKKQISFHEHNEKEAGKRIIGLLKEGKKIALVSNAGTPGISDPGFTLVRSVIEERIEVTMIPGATAFLPALVLSGLPVHSFTYRGFAPRKSGKRKTFFEADKESPYTLIYYEAPHRLKAFLKDALEIFGDRRAALAKELTKMFETVRRGRISELVEGLEENPKGEYVVVIEGADVKGKKKRD
ncbi:MAG: 16S rRNA (cytidine(1402)-2'-O)-methyltransferase [Planctomycetota bacterium]